MDEPNKKTFEEVVKEACGNIHKAFVEAENERMRRRMYWPRRDERGVKVPVEPIIEKKEINQRIDTEDKK